MSEGRTQGKTAAPSSFKISAIVSHQATTGVKDRSHLAMPGTPVSHHQRSSDSELQEPMEKYGQHPQDQSACPESRTLYNKLVSQLSMAACEAQMEHMAIRCPSTASTISRDTSLIAASGVSSRPESMTSNGSPISTDAFQDLLFKMLEEEWAAHTQLPGGPQ